MTGWGVQNTLQPERKTEDRSRTLGDTIRRQFRAVVKHLTGREPTPRPRSRRRREEVAGSFKTGTAMVFRRVRTLLPFQSLNPAWEPFTWLHLCQWNDGTEHGIGTDAFERDASPSSPHL
jgi:hypothetical protein